MKIGRVILTHRADLVPSLKAFYLGERTDFLVIACNTHTVDITKFEQTENFKVIGYLGKGASGTITGKQFQVWVKAAKTFPEIEAWVMHDYDVLVKPDDKTIMSKVGPTEYACVGRPFYNWQPGMEETKQDIYPFLYHYVSASDNKDNTYLGVEKVLLKYFPVKFKGIDTVLTGYTDLLATSAQNLRLLDDSRVEEIEVGGLDQIPHTVFAHNSIKAVDLRRFFSTIISVDNTLYVPFNNKFDISHTIKFWPGVNKVSLKQRLKKFLKIVLKSGRIPKSFPGKY